MNIIKKYKTTSGQAMTALLLLMFLGITIISAAVSLIDTNISTTANLVLSNHAQMAAESGAEEALINLLRNPNYTGGTLNIDGATVSINISGSTPLIVESIASLTNHQRTVRLSVFFVNGTMYINSWKQI